MPLREWLRGEIVLQVGQQFGQFFRLELIGRSRALFQQAEPHMGRHARPLIVLVLLREFHQLIVSGWTAGQRFPPEHVEFNQQGHGLLLLGRLAGQYAIGGVQQSLVEAGPLAQRGRLLLHAIEKLDQFPDR